MREILGMIAGIVAALCAIVLVLCAFGDWVYRKGRAKGYQQGRKDADNWWIGAEQQSDQARQQIWREEAER